MAGVLQHSQTQCHPPEGVILSDHHAPLAAALRQVIGMLAEAGADTGKRGAIVEQLSRLRALVHETGLPRPVHDETDSAWYAMPGERDAERAQSHLRRALRLLSTDADPLDPPAEPSGIT